MNEDEPTSFLEAVKNPRWVKEMEEEIDSIMKNKTWRLVKRPLVVILIGLKWVFKIKIKRDASGAISKYKARLVAKGYLQQMGYDFDEVFAPEDRIETVRIMLALAASKGWEIHHLDVKSAFLHGELQEDVYVEQREGFVKAGCERMVYKLDKALYGLRQAPRTWNIKLDGILKSMKFKHCVQEQVVYRYRIGNDLIVVGVYVDDLIVRGSSVDIIKRFKAVMSTKFKMSYLGILRYYLGIEVYQSMRDVIVTQEAYAKKVLKDAGMSNCNPTLIHMDCNKKFSKAQDEKEVDATDYRSLIGRLRYILQTRTDLAFLHSLLELLVVT